MKYNKVCNSWAPSPPRHVGSSRHGRARKGYVPVVAVGPAGDGLAGERFLIPAQFMGHPSIVGLLERSRDEFGYDQQGVIRIPCDPDSFRDIIKRVNIL